MRALSTLLLSISTSFLLRKGAAQDDQTKIANHLTAWKECSFGGKEWALCLKPGYGALYYCPTGDESVDPITNPGPLQNITWWGQSTTCLRCPRADPVYGYDCLSSMENLKGIHNITEYEHGYNIDYCTKLCESGLEEDGCSDENECTAGSHFCDYSAEDKLSGSCVECPEDINDCYEDGFLTSHLALTACFNCRLDCLDVGLSSVNVDGVEIAPSEHVHGANQELSLSGSGPLVDCSNLVLQNVDICLGAKDHVCLVEDFTKDTLAWQISQKAEESGCVALIKYIEGDFGGRHHSKDNLAIPFVEIQYDDGKHLKDEKLGTMAYVDVHLLGSACYHSSEYQLCTDVFACEANEYCDFSSVVQDGEYVEGWCQECPTDENGSPDPSGCFFDRHGGHVRTEKEVTSCAESCNYKLKFDGCKFCPNDVTGFEFGVEDGSEQCTFCPHYDVLYPDRLVPIFGEGITCWSMQAFFENLKLSKDSQNCKLAQSYNFICGCKGTGYGGASSQAKKATLVWLPRMMALLSLLGSIFIVHDTTRTHQKRTKLANQLLCTLSVFDIFGSIAYALTSLPTPESDYLHGSHGNTNTCIAQGFFIQLGTTACFLNASLAISYTLSVTYGWSEERLKEKRVFLFVPPILVGLSFAFAGIPFYDTMILWCNNSASWWPEIPVIISIAMTTGIMGSMCLHVYKVDRATAQYSSNTHGISKLVFKQSCWFVGAFYITWVPYLALQYMWSSGKAFTMYGFILSAGTLVPLQGFWNFLVYIRPRLGFSSRMGSTGFSSVSLPFGIGQSRKYSTQVTTEQNHNSTQQQAGTNGNDQHDN